MKYTASKRSHVFAGRAPMGLGRVLAHRSQALAHEEDGQAVVLVAVWMIVLVLFVGLAVDVGSARMAKRKLQFAADAAAVAAALEIRQCGSSAGCPAMQNAALSALQENGYTSISTSTNCAGASSGTAITVSINQGPCAMGGANPNNGKTTSVEVVVSAAAPLTFSRIVGLNSLRVNARAEASRPVSLPCMVALDPHGAAAVSFVTAVAVNFQCNIVDESDSPVALGCLAGLGLTVPSANVTGGAAGLLCSVPNLRTGVPVPTPADPLAYLPTPSVGACGSSSGNTYYGSSSNVTIALGGTYTFNPGVYCGGISITAATASNITFNPGVYILKDGPGTFGLPTGGFNLTLSLLSNITATGVTFYNAGVLGGFNISASTTAGLSNVAISAPTTGPYSGVLFMQNPGNTLPDTFTANLLTGSKIEGAVYSPSALVSYGISAVSSAYSIVVAKDINFTVTVATTFGADYSALAAGSPIYGTRALLNQ